MSITPSAESRVARRPRLARRLALANTALALAIAATLAAPIAQDVASAATRTALGRQATAVSGFDLSGFMSMLGQALTAWGARLNPFVEATVTGLEKQDGAVKEIAQAGLNYEAARDAAQAVAGAVDTVGVESDSACEIKRSTMEAVDAKAQEGLLARAMTSYSARRSLYNASGSLAAREMLGKSFGDYCSPESYARGRCSGAVSPKNMPDADVQAASVFTTSDTISKTMSSDEFDAANQWVKWVTAPVPEEPLPIAMQDTPAGRRYFLEQRRRSAVMSSAQFALNRTIASRWEKK